VRTKSFVHGGLKHIFSQVEGDLDLQETLKLAPLPKKITTKKKVIIVTMKEEDEESEKAEKLGWMLKFYIRLHYEEKWRLNLPKMERNNLLKPFFFKFKFLLYFHN
jgi:hypothetical protein